MELQKVLLKRRSVRKFTEEVVSVEDIRVLMHAAMSGPSACNYCPWEFYVVSNPEKLEMLRLCSRYSRIHAPLAIVVCGNSDHFLPGEGAGFWVQDCSAATENILLQAVDLGLGTVWCGIYPDSECVARVQRALELPEKIVPLNVIYAGHPVEEAQERDQYLEERVHFIR